MLLLRRGHRDLVVTGSILAGGGNFFKHRVGVHTPSHHPHMTEIPLKRDAKLQVIQPSICTLVSM